MIPETLLLLTSKELPKNLTEEELQVWKSKIHFFNLIFILVLYEMIEEADRAGGGEVNQDDFLRIMKKTSLY
jgi:hypothetical protein